MYAYHRHIAAMIRTLNPDPARILDAGCGDGELMAYLQTQFPADIYGYDVCDEVWSGNYKTAAPFLAERFPDVPWDDRVRAIRSTEPLPFADQTFDFVVSNQVGEHVFDFNHFISETMRVIRPGGYAIHVFPSREILWDGHVKQPLSHRIPKPWWIGLWQRIGVGRRVKSPAEWAAFFRTKTCYRPCSEILAAYPGVNTAWTFPALSQKLHKPKQYRRPAPFMTFLAKRLFSITFVIPKPR